MMILIRADGTVQDLPGSPETTDVARLIGANVLDCVNLGGGHVMMVDDLGHEKNLPHNEKATQIYRATRARLSNWSILGDVVIMHDGGVM